MKRVLLICGPKLGDVVVRIPVIEYLKKYKFDVYILQETWNLMGKNFLEIFNIIKKNKILPLDRRNRLFLIKFILKYYYYFDYIFCTAPTTQKTKLLAKALYPKNKIFYHDFNVKDKKCIIEADKDNLKKLLNQSTLDYTLSDFSYVLTRKIKNIKVNNQKIVVFPGVEIRSFSQECWNAIIKYLTDKFGKVILIGGKDTLWLKIKNKQESIIDLRDKIDFLTSLSYINNCKVLITANSGIMWIGALLNKKVIAFHGPTRWSWEYKHPNILNIRLWNYDECIGFPCEVGKFCDNKFHCIKSIKPEEIIKKFEENIKFLY